MAIMIGITPKGIKDYVILANTYEEQLELVTLFKKIEPEVTTFKDSLNKKLSIYQGKGEE